MEVVVEGVGVGVIVDFVAVEAAWTEEEEEVDQVGLVS